LRAPICPCEGARYPARQVARWVVGNGQGRGPFDTVLAWREGTVETDTDILRAREGATPDRRGSRERRRRSVRLMEGVAPSLA